MIHFPYPIFLLDPYPLILFIRLHYSSRLFEGEKSACYEPDPTKRPTAHQLAQGFHQALRWVEKKEKKSKEELKNLFVA